MCRRSPYKVLGLQVYDMQILGDTHIYQEGGILPPCMVLLQSQQQEESDCVLLVNEKALCSWEDLLSSKSQPLSLWEEHNTELRYCAVLWDLHIKKTNSHYIAEVTSPICKILSDEAWENTHQKKKNVTNPHACHPASSKLCNLWIWALAARALSNITKGIRADCGNHPDSNGEPPVMGPLGVNSCNTGWHVGKHWPRCSLSVLQLCLTAALPHVCLNIKTAHITWVNLFSSPLQKAWVSVCKDTCGPA